MKHALLAVLTDLLESQSCFFFPSLPFTFIYQIISNIHTSTDTHSKVATRHSLNLVQFPFAEALGTSMSSQVLSQKERQN